MGLVFTVVKLCSILESLSPALTDVVVLFIYCVQTTFLK